MKNSKIYLGLATVLIAGSISLSSCHKKSTQPELDNEQSTATDNNLAEGSSSDIESIGSQVTDAGTLSTFRTDGSTQLAIAPCATITGVGTPTVTVDFGTTGCLGTDGRTRTGKLIYDFSASTSTNVIHYRSPGFSMKVTSVSYVVDGNQINIINKTVTNTTPNTIPTGPNPGTNLTWAISANISVVKANNGGTIAWSCSRTKELTNTSTTNCYGGQGVAIDWSKAIIKLNGTASGTNVKGESFTATATNLVRDFNCAPSTLKPHRHPFISGIISYTPGSRPTRVIDFGNGSCDFGATITVNGQTFAINLD